MGVQAMMHMQMAQQYGSQNDAILAKKYFEVSGERDIRSPKIALIFMFQNVESVWLNICIGN